MKIRADLEIKPTRTKVHEPKETFQRSQTRPSKALDVRVLGVDIEAKEQRFSDAPTTELAKVSRAPRILSPEAPQGVQKVLPLPPMLDIASKHTENFLSLLPAGTAKSAWSEVWTYQPNYDQNRLNLPFPTVLDSDGLLENNLMSVTVKGLRKLGADAEARGVLENWLSLGEKYTALPGNNSLAELGRSGQPRLSGLVLEEFRHHADPDFMRRSYEVIKGDYEHNWSDTYFKRTSNGLNRYCDVDYSHDAAIIESGGEYNSGRFQGDPAPYNPVDLNCYLYKTEKDMAVMSRALGLPSEPWEERARERKSKILELCWDEDRGTFVDYDYKNGTRSQTESLAALAVLETGLLDLSSPREALMAKRVVESSQKLLSVDRVQWDSSSQASAPARELVGFVDGLRDYGFEDFASKLHSSVRDRLRDSPVKPDVEELSLRALLEPSSDVPRDVGLAGWMSPEGGARLRRVAPFLAAEAAEVSVQKAGALDRRLLELDESLLNQNLLEELKDRDILSQVFNLDVVEGKIEHKQAQLNFQPGPSEFELAGVKVKFGVPGLEISKLDQGAVVLKKDGVQMPFAVTDQAVLLGDRAYPRSRFQGEASLPEDLFSNFFTAGGNPTLETFFHKNREWVTPSLGPHCGVESPAGRPGWKRLYDLTHNNWPELTIEPSVVDHDTAVQYFNQAAVPSVGIFKTQFNWDTMFMAKGMQLQGQESLVSDMADNLLYLLKSTGRVPNAARSVYLNKSQPPFLPSLVRMCEPIRARNKGPEAAQEWVEEAYSIMADDYRNFWREDGERGVSEIDGKKVTLSRWGGANHKFAMDESGFDTASRFYGKTKDLIPPDLNAFLWGYARDMEVIALRLRDKAEAKGETTDFLRLSTEASFWGSEKDKIKKDLIEYCWDDQDGMFRDYRFQGEEQGLQRDEDALSPCVAPLWVGMLDPKNPREKLMIERSLDNVSRFEKEHGLAATAEDYGHPEMQWNGPSGWAPLQMMAIEAEVANGRFEAAGRHSQKWLDTMEKIQARDGVIIERYDMVKGDHPPVQKGRYEETQGEGPGFGWTNATVPWAMVEVLGGVRLHRDPAHPTRMDIIPNLPEGLQGEPYEMTFADPGSAESYQLKHNYHEAQGEYEFSLSGKFTDIEKLNLVTPPLPAGLIPISECTAAYRVKQQTLKSGKVRYQIEFDGLQGQQKLGLQFKPEL